MGKPNKYTQFLSRHAIKICLIVVIGISVLFLFPQSSAMRTLEQTSDIIYNITGNDKQYINDVNDYVYYRFTYTATWYRGTISIAPAGAPVTYTLYSTSGAQLWQATQSAQIPNATGRDTSPCIIVAESSTDAAADILRLDYVRWGTTKVVRR